jgi:hypothetical protein
MIDCINPKEQEKLVILYVENSQIQTILVNIQEGEVESMLNDMIWEERSYRDLENYEDGSIIVIQKYDGSTTLRPLFDSDGPSDTYDLEEEREWIISSQI